MRRLRKIFGNGWILSVFSVAIVSVFPAIFMYCSNAGETDFNEILSPLLVLGGMGLAIYLVCALVMQSGRKAGIFASIYMLVFTNYALIERVFKALFPSIRYWHVISVVLIILLHIGYAVYKYISNDVCYDVTKVLVLAFGGLTVFNIITCVPSVIKRVEAKQEILQSKNTISGDVAVLSENFPNFYLLLFDEYANFPQMETYYNYDNAVLRDFLEQNNFTISYDSHNESIMTTTIVTNLMNLDYVVDNTFEESEKEVIRKQGVLFSTMEEHGYQVKVVETGNFFGHDSPTRNTSEDSAKTINGEGISDLCFKKTAIYPFYRGTVYDSEILGNINQVLEYLENPDNIPQSPTFTIGYVSFPHQPFIVDENGYAISVVNSANWKEPTYYLGQFKYATKRILRILNNLIENDPNAVIILQSDHGARASTDENFMKIFPLDVMNNNLNVVRFCGEGLESIRGLSSVNTMRYVLSQLFNEDWDIVPVPVDDYNYK